MRTKDFPTPPQPRPYLEVFSEVCAELTECRRLLAEEHLHPEVRQGLEATLRDCDEVGERVWLDEITTQRIEIDYQRRWFEYARSAEGWDLGLLPQEFHLARKAMVKSANDGLAAMEGNNPQLAYTCFVEIQVAWERAMNQRGEYLKNEARRMGGKQSTRLEGVYQLCLQWLRDSPELSAKELWRLFSRDWKVEHGEYECWVESEKLCQQIGDKPIKSIAYSTFETEYHSKARGELGLRKKKKLE